MKPLAIIGLGAGWSRAPWKSKRYDRWTLNAAWKRFAGWQSVSCTAWFELHSRRYLSEEWGGETAHFDALAVLPATLYVQRPKAWKAFNAQRFPREQVARAFPLGSYHASSIDWMLAFALWKGYKDIGIWGVNFGPNEGGEPMSARPCLEYWIGLGRGMGRTITVHEPTGLFWIYNVAKHKTPYHYDDTWRLIESRR
jgi:hypothetical protein